MTSLSLFDAPEPATRTAVAKAAKRQRLTSVPPDVVAAFRASTVSSDAYSVELHLPRMSPRAYAKAKSILSLCGFFWSTAHQTHRGNHSAQAAFAKISATGEYDDTVRGLEFFATSESLADELAVDFAEHVWSAGAPWILEPSAGDGALVAAVLETMPDAVITAVELDRARFAELRDRFSSEPRVRVVCSDILDFDECGWDGVIMNPPFAESEAHIKRVASLARNGAYILGIALLTRAQDAGAADWLHDHDAMTWECGGSAFVGTSINASCFSFRTGRSTLDELREALKAHPSLAEAHIRQLTSLSRELHDLFVAHCNGDIESDLYESTVREALTRAKTYVQHEGIRIDPAWDPRAGYGFGLILPSGQTNDFGRSRMIVPNARLEATGTRWTRRLGEHRQTPRVTRR